MRRLLAAAFLALAAARGYAAERVHVYLVILDGMDDHFATPELWPTVHALVRADPVHASLLHGQAVMPTRTNTDHATLLSGTYAEAHAITGNAFWPRKPQAPAAKLDDAVQIEVETFFTAAKAVHPELVTMGVF